MSKKNFQALKSLKRNYLILFILFTALTFALIYNSCSSEGSKSVKFSKILNNLGPGFSVIINSGFYATQRKNVTLKFEVPRKNLKGEIVDYEMKVSRNSDCSDGEWEDYQPTKDWTLDDKKTNESNIEKKYFAYTKFREKRPENVNYVFRSGAQGESDCIHDSIVYDTYPPRLTIESQPNKRTGQKNAHFKFKGEDFERERIFFQCRIDPTSTPKHTCDHSQEDDNSPWKPCPSLEYEQSLTLRQTKENFRFSLKGIDAAGNCKILEYEWTIDQTIPSIGLDCPKTNSNEETGKIKATLRAPDTSDTFSLFCKKNNQFGDCNCQGSNPCTAITHASPQTFIQKESFIKKRLDVDGTYHKHSLSVKLKNTESGTFSDPATCEWFVDSKPPEVQFLQLLTSQNNKHNYDGKFNFVVSDNSDINNSGVLVDLNYEITDSSSGQNYGGNLSIKDCNTKLSKSGGCNFQVQNITPGIKSNPKQYTISVSATDLAGNKSSPKKFSFHVLSGAIKNSNTHTVNQSSGKADILFVLDDSGSMGDEATVLGQSFSGIISSLSDLNWQIAVTSMEKDHTNFGKLVQLINNTTNKFLTDTDNQNQYILSSQPTCQAPLYCDSNKNELELEEIFKRTITIKRDQEYQPIGDNNFIFDGGREYGIQSVNVLLDYYNHYKNNNGRSNPVPRRTLYPLPDTDGLNAINSFFRENSTFVVIFIADEKNCGLGLPITTCHNNIVNQPENLINQVMTTFEDDKKFISYPIIPEYREGYSRLYPQRTDDDYWKLAKATQGRENESGTDPVIWVDVDHTDNRTPRSNGSRCSTNSNTNPIGIYTNDLCAISDDILNVERSSISLSCNNPIVDAQHKIDYSYKENNLASTPVQPLSKNTENQIDVIVNNETHRIQVTEPQPESPVNRILLKSTKQGASIPNGTYQVDYFCPSKGIIYATERANAINALNNLQQQTE